MLIIMLLLLLLLTIVVVVVVVTVTGYVVATTNCDVEDDVDVDVDVEMGVTVDNTTVTEVIDVVLEMEKMIAQIKNQVSITCSIKELMDKKYNNETRHSQAMLKIHLLANNIVIAFN